MAMQVVWHLEPGKQMIISSKHCRRSFYLNLYGLNLDLYRIAVYKALYPFGGYMSDVVAAVEQVIELHCFYSSHNIFVVCH